MRKLFRECGDGLNKYRSEYDWLSFYYIADADKFKEQVTISDYYRILLVDNSGELTVDELNSKLQKLKNKDDIIYYDMDSYEEVVEILNSEYDLNLEFNVSLYYDDFDFFKNGYIVYDNEKKCFDNAVKWEEIVTTYRYLEEHGFIATMQISVENFSLESAFPEIYIDELDEIVEIEVDEDEEAEIDEDSEIVVLNKNIVERTSVKKLDDDKYLIIISSEIPGHINMAAIVTEEELVKYMEIEQVIDLDKYFKKINMLF
ncbi:MAG: hypothetical protein ACERLG_08570 [Sedimentibacter sp.]